MPATAERAETQAWFDKAMLGACGDPRYLKLEHMIGFIDDMLRSPDLTADQLAEAAASLEAEMEAVEARASVCIPFKPRGKGKGGRS